MTSIRQYIKQKLVAWARQDNFYHFVFWISLYILLVIAEGTEKGFLFIMTLQLINVGFYAAIAYFNWLYLFPAYLKDRNLLKHFGFLALLALLITPIKTLLFFQLSNHDPLIQQEYLDRRLFIYLSTFFVGTSTTIYKIMNDWLIQQRDKKELESQNLQSELKFLKSQINPHFLFNTLNSLYALTLKKSDLAPEIVLKLSEMMRYMLYECNEKQVPLKKEVKYLQNYLELEKLRHGNKMEIDFKINGDLTNQKIAPLVMMPFVENAFKHGINHQVSQGFVNLELNVFENDLQMVLENSKSPSIPKIGDIRSGGIGLVNVKRRMNILYPDNFQLEIRESPLTYKVELNLHLIDI
ncbi:MAG: histidine kinase [Saprospiraceae bacterium]|nr:histidine kinase [Saprospiraceae bacterium]